MPIQVFSLDSPKSGAAVAAWMVELSLSHHFQGMSSFPWFPSLI